LSPARSSSRRDGKVVVDDFRGVARDHRNPLRKRVMFPAVRQDLRAELGLHATGEVWDVVCVDDDQPEVRPP